MSSPSVDTALPRHLLERFAALPLAALEREYPNHLTHNLQGEDDVRSPRQLHPVFYGCYDWHSAVHGYWLLLRCLHHDPALPQRSAIEALFERRFTATAIAGECDYFQAPGRASFERPYGWAWLLMLACELRLSALPGAATWAARLAPLTALIRQRLLDFLPAQNYPIRAGTHANTAFALQLALHYARGYDDQALLAQVRASAWRYYRQDHDYPAHYEPGGDDFLSGALTEASLMAELLPQEDLLAWLDGFLPRLGQVGDALLQPVQVGDHSDPKFSHLDGLHFSRAWCLRRLASRLPQSHPALPALRLGAQRQFDASLPQLASGHYAGDHWLATFAMLAAESP